MTREEKEAMKDKAIHDAMCSIENRVRHVYNQGYSDGIADGNINIGLLADRVREAYNNGLGDAWECARKILFDDSLSRDILTELGADSFSGVIHKCSASEAIEKIKEYEKCQDCKYAGNPPHAVCGGCVSKNRFEPKQTEEKIEKSCDNCRFDWDNYEASGISYDVKHNHCIACDHSSGFEAIKDDDEIKVGDEVEICGTGSHGVVTSIAKFNNKYYYRCVKYNGDLCTENDDFPPKNTGRHFPQITEVLKQMQEGASE